MIPLSKKPIVGFIVCVFFFIIPTHAQENLFDYTNTIKFARYLSSSNQYTFAIQEYERLNHYFPNDTSIHFELVQTYRLNKQCDKFLPSYDLLNKNNRLYKNASFRKEILDYSLSCKIQLPDFFELSALMPQKEQSFYDLSYYWVNKQHAAAFNYNSKHQEILHLGAPTLSLLTKEFEQQKFKKPGIALLMSSIIPGSGKAYSKKWGDAFVSFLFVGMNTYAAYRAFNKKGVKSTNGWIFGGIAFSFYSANLWGSFNAAKKYNSNLKLKYQNNAENLIYNSF